MRANRLNRWIAGGLAGCPGIVDVSPTDAPPASMPAPRAEAMSPAADRTTLRVPRSGWVTAAAAILVIHGVIGFVYAPMLTGSDLGVVQPVFILVVGVSALAIVTGVGLFRQRDWARSVAGALAGLSLLFLCAPAFLFAMTNDSLVAFDWVGLGGSIFLLYVVLRRWPSGRRG